MGITRTKERTEMVGRHRVIFIESAELREVSLVAAGTCEQAFCRLVDANQSPSPKDSVKSNPFKIDSGLHNIKVQRGKIENRIESLKERLSALEGGRRDKLPAGMSAASRGRWLSLNGTNRRRTEEMERLAARSRLLHCFF